jgi:thiamine-monophosphate kinase
LVERTNAVDMSEDDLLDAIARLLSDHSPDVVVGIGDDAAVVRPASGDLVLTTDALVEGSHFLRSSSVPRDLGFRAVVVNVSDVAAMAASPRYALAALTLPPDVDAAYVTELIGGMRDACGEYGCLLVGGNLASGRELTLAVTVTGEVAPGRAVTRAGAGLGDVVVVTGELGASAAARRVRDEPTRWTDDDRAALRRAERPTARVGEAQVLASHGATGMLDVSDGLALDLWRMCRASGIGARLRLDAVPIAPTATLDEAIGGGEDYELLATLPPDAVDGATAELADVFGVALTAIGGIIEGGVVGVDADGGESPLEPKGWDHFG